MKGMQRFTVYRRNLKAAGKHNEDQGNADDAPQFEGVIFSDGTVSVRWLTACASHSVWSSIESLLRIHGHPEYGTEIIWHDGDEPAVWTQMCDAAGVTRASTPFPVTTQLRIAELECEILRNDARRLDWMEKHPWELHRPGNGFLFLRVGGNFAGGNTLRDAVDCAIELMEGTS